MTRSATQEPAGGGEREEACAQERHRGAAFGYVVFLRNNLKFDAGIVVVAVGIERQAEVGIAGGATRGATIVDVGGQLADLVQSESECNGCLVCTVLTAIHVGPVARSEERRVGK